MKTNLAYIQSAAESAVENTKRTVLEVVGGLRIARQVETTSEVESYRTCASKVRADLEKVGVTPLAILPETWWSKIVQDTGLIDISSKDDCAYFKDGVNSDALEEAKLINGAISIALGVLTFLALSVASYVVAQDFASAAFLVVMSFIPSLVVAGAASFLLSKTDLIYDWVMSRPGAIKRYVAFENRCNTFTSRTMKFELPTPPADVGEAILKARETKLDMRVAAEPSAFSFSPSPAELLRALNDQRVADEKRRREALLADPIVYVRYGSAVAIVAQFGDFPVEKEVVDRVMGQGL